MHPSLQTVQVRDVCLRRTVRRDVHAKGAHNGGKQLTCCYCFVWKHPVVRRIEGSASGLAGEESLPGTQQARFPQIWGEPETKVARQIIAFTEKNFTNCRPYHYFPPGASEKCQSQRARSHQAPEFTFLARQSCVIKGSIGQTGSRKSIRLIFKIKYYVFFFSAVFHFEMRMWYFDFRKIINKAFKTLNMWNTKMNIYIKMRFLPPQKIINQINK